jgi:hypothetical protein
VRPGSRCLLFASPKRRYQEKGDRPAGSQKPEPVRGKAANSLRSNNAKQVNININFYFYFNFNFNVNRNP